MLKINQIKLPLTADEHDLRRRVKLFALTKTEYVLSE